MKPMRTTLSRSNPRRPIIGVLLLAGAAAMVGCGPSSNNNGDRADAAPPPKVKKPPEPKSGTSTAAGCNGVTEAGKCEGGVAVTCNVDSGQLRRKDCTALGSACVEDSERGAMCSPGPSCATGLTVLGECGGEGGQVARWCDEQSQTTQVWNCASDGMACTVDTCATGAFCCGATPPPPSELCPELGFRGECVDSGRARWCEGDVLRDITCEGGDTCQVDACEEGAYCCPPPGGADECERLGFDGECTTQGTVRWCRAGEVVEKICEGEETCQVDACTDGAWCCGPPSE